MTMMAPKHEPDLASMLAWQSGYVTGLRVARQIYAECNEPASRLDREIDVSISDAHQTSKRVDTIRLD